MTVSTDLILELQSIRERASRVMKSVPVNQGESSRCVVGQLKWDFNFLKVAQLIAEWSKDPSTKCGAVIVDDQHRIVSTGYNGFAASVQDLDSRYRDRSCKLDMVIHAEENAILFADRVALQNATIYTWPFLTCSRCAAKLIQVGIRRVVSTDLIIPRWEESLIHARQQYADADCQVILYSATELVQSYTVEGHQFPQDNEVSPCTSTLSHVEGVRHEAIGSVQ